MENQGGMAMGGIGFLALVAAFSPARPFDEQQRSVSLPPSEVAKAINGDEKRYQFGYTKVSSAPWRVTFGKTIQSRFEATAGGQIEEKIAERFIGGPVRVTFEANRPILVSLSTISGGTQIRVKIDLVASADGNKTVLIPHVEFKDGNIDPDMREAFKAAVPKYEQHFTGEVATWLRNEVLKGQGSSSDESRQTVSH